MIGGMRKKLYNSIISKIVVGVFLAMILARDIFGLGIPLIAFTAVWIVGLLVWDVSECAAYTTAATICFANSISITVPIFAFIIIILMKNKKFYPNAILVCSILILILEGTKFIQYADQNFRLYVNYSMIILLVATVVSFEVKDAVFDAGLMLKAFVGAFLFLSTDILFLTIRSYGSLAAITQSSFRIGQTEYLEDTVTSTMSMNANGIGLLAIAAIAVVVLLTHYRRMQRKFAIPIGIYFSVIGFLTISKSFFIVFAIMAVLFILDNSVTNSRDPAKVILVFIVAGILVYGFTRTSLYDNIMQRFQAGDITTGRFESTQEYLSFMRGSMTNRFFGVGLQNVTDKAGIINVPHNAILEMYVCLGYFGILIYLFFFAKLIQLANRNYAYFYGRRIPFINYIPFIAYFSYIQGLQFLRISYIYCLLIIVTVCLMMAYRMNPAEQELA